MGQKRKRSNNRAGISDVGLGLIPKRQESDCPAEGESRAVPLNGGARNGVEGVLAAQAGVVVLVVEGEPVAGLTADVEALARCIERGLPYRGALRGAPQAMEVIYRLS